MGFASMPASPASMSLLPIEKKRVKSFDGTEIAYYATRKPKKDAPSILLANGLGGPFLAFRPLIEFFLDRFHLITWDYRGLYESARPLYNRPSDYTVAHHVRDLEAIISAEHIERASLIGWSMGVQIALETFRTKRQLLKTLVLMNGTTGRPLDTLTPLPGAKILLPPLVRAARHAHGIATQVTRRAMWQPESPAWLKRMGFIGPTLDDEVFAELVFAFSKLDMEGYLHNLSAINDHDAKNVLSSINIPTLIITGDRDSFTPPELAQRMATRIPRSEILIVREGTHYTPVEFPELVNLRIERFFRDHSG